MGVSDDGEATNELEAGWEYHGYTWSCISSDGHTVFDLRPAGRERAVAWEEREEYRAAWLAYRLNEFRQQVEHMRKGMATIVPIQLLSLFTWQELQLNVCGKGEIDIAFLQVKKDLMKKI